MGKVISTGSNNGKISKRGELGQNYKQEMKKNITG